MHLGHLETELRSLPPQPTSNSLLLPALQTSVSCRLNSWENAASSNAALPNRKGCVSLKRQRTAPPKEKLIVSRSDLGTLREAELWPRQEDVWGMPGHCRQGRGKGLDENVSKVIANAP